MTTETDEPLCPDCLGTGLVAGSPFLGDRTPWGEHLASVVESYRDCPPEASWTFLGREKPLPCGACGGLRRLSAPYLIVGASGRLELAGVTDPAEELAFLRRFALPAPPSAEYAAPPAEYAAPEPEYPADPDPWCLAFVSELSGLACFQSRAGVKFGLIQSTTTPLEIAAWPDAAGVLDWMAAKGMALSRPLPVGVGHLRPAPHQFDARWYRARPDWMAGTLFEVPPRPAPAPVPTATNAAVRAAVESAREAEAQAARPGARGGPRKTKRELAAACAAGQGLMFDEAGPVGGAP